ncbi:uncharacterized protein LOC134179253 [Corticium candelabrum]|uniref:uncharacterized protein LOC134179253 n=1 Tax=Corticium candelabrum TaxID=121492 RepID=UPI002E2700C2|nr:uncharacterized protein LOC134179253 [Corticium candelabrum]
MASGRKRSSPWGEISPLQFKMHVGMKEGATDFEKLVGCLRTQARMMAAARNLHFQIDGSRCQSCNATRPPSCCVFCERPVCGDCARICTACSLSFCPLCSTIQYSEQWKDEKVTCLSCLSS